MSSESEKATTAREKYWEEADPNDKADRLRDEVARLCRLVTEQRVTIARLCAHAHGPTGQILVPIMAELENPGPALFAHDNGIPHRIRKQHERR